MEIVEPGTVPEIYIDAVAHIEEMPGGNLRFTLVSDHQSATDAEQTIRVVRAYLVMHAENALEASRVSYLAASGLSGCVGKTMVELVH